MVGQPISQLEINKDKKLWVVTLLVEEEEAKIKAVDGTWTCQKIISKQWNFEKTLVHNVYYYLNFSTQSYRHEPGFTRFSKIAPFNSGICTVFSNHPGYWNFVLICLYYCLYKKIFCIKKTLSHFGLKIHEMS